MVIQNALGRLYRLRTIQIAGQCLAACAGIAILTCAGFVLQVKDVYKRQHIPSPAISMEHHIAEILKLWMTRMINFCNLRCSNISLCLLYTSRCV